ncbi:MAG: metallophosphoesterase [Myxococcota bacterium]
MLASSFFRATIRLVLVLVLGAACALTLACSQDDLRTESPSPDGSFLAIGDTGEPWGPWPSLLEPQLAVGHALERAHRGSPVDAFVLLGDNFYPEGLRAEELVSRVIQNVALPYCAFVRPSNALREALGGACPEAASPPPIYAVVGNHDVMANESVRLQRTKVPEYVVNWEVPTSEGPAIRELPGGLSLIFIVSEWPWDEDATQALADALRRAQGPFRVIVGHRPTISGHPQLLDMVATAARQANTVVHAYVAGHVHVLGAIPGERRGLPRLTVIAGSGAHAEHQPDTEYQIENADFLEASLGFARFDVFSNADDADAQPTLRVTLHRVPSLPPLAKFRAPEIAARYSIDVRGRIARDENVDR